MLELECKPRDQLADPAGKALYAFAHQVAENGAAPSGKWADIAVLEPVRDYKARHASTMLTFEAVVDAIGQIESKSGSEAEQLSAAEG